MVTATDIRPVEFPVRRGRNLAALVLLVVLAGMALWVAYSERADLGLAYWWVPVFPLLALATAYRQARPRVPIALRPDGIAVVTGMALLGLKTTIPWNVVQRLRVTAMGLLLVELKTGASWVEGQPWLVRANVRANERKHRAAVVQPLRELRGTPAQIIAALRAASPVPVDAPRVPKGTL